MSREQRLEAALQEAQQCLYRDGANAAGEVKALIDAVLGEQEAPEPEPPSVAEVLIRSLNEAIDACAAVFRDTAEHGPAQALENLADFLNAKDAVGDDDPEWYERAQARLAASAPQGEPEPTTWEQAEDPHGLNARTALLRQYDQSVGWPAAPQVAPEPERCPTCRSDNPSIHVTGTPQNPDRERCPDPWHRPAPLVEEERPDA